MIVCEMNTVHNVYSTLFINYKLHNVSTLYTVQTTFLSGENITEYLSRQDDGRLEGICNNKYQLLHLHYVPELHEVYCTTNRRTVMVSIASVKCV